MVSDDEKATETTTSYLVVSPDCLVIDDIVLDGENVRPVDDGDAPIALENERVTVRPSVEVDADSRVGRVTEVVALTLAEATESE
jgi:hypothetical protein